MKAEYQKYLNYVGGVRFWIIVMGVIVAFSAIKYASGLVNMLLLALFLTSISLAPLEWLKKKGIPATISIIIIILALLVVVGLTGIVIGSSANNFVEKMPFYQDKFNDIWNGISNFLINYGIMDKGSKPLQELNPANLLPYAGTFFAGFGNVMANSLIVFFIFIFMIFESESFGKKVSYISPESSEQTHRIIIQIRRYFGIKFITSLSTGVLITVALLIIGVDFPVLWGFLAFILNFIPSIGSFIAAIPAVLLALIQLGPWVSLVTIIVYFVINTIIGNIIEPQMMGKNLGISPLIVFISMIFFGYLLGPIGMLIATPLAILLKIIFDSRPVTRNLGILLGDGTDLEEKIQK